MRLSMYKIHRSRIRDNVSTHVLRISNIHLVSSGHPVDTADVRIYGTREYRIAPACVKRDSDSVLFAWRMI